jgi:hypothetical protein
MVTADNALSSLPDGLRSPLLEEFDQIVRNYLEHRWTSAELFAGRFCEVVYTILDGYGRNSYAAAPQKPRDFVAACRTLESHSSVPRSFQILIPRLLPALYEIRNNRNVGHVGGDVNPDFMDSSFVVSASSWIMAELIRVLHGLDTKEAQRIADDLSERRIPLVWKSGDLRRVLRVGLSLKDQVLLLLASTVTRTPLESLFTWSGYKDMNYFRRCIRELHSNRLIEFHESAGEVELLPPGAEYVAKLVVKEMESKSR